MSTLTFKLKRLKQTVKAWEKNMKQTQAKESKDVDLAIHSLLSSHISVILSFNEASLLSHLKSRKESLLAHQILNWKLKSRVDWLNEGDVNTKFFHSYASARRNSKSIWALQNQHGELIEDETQLNRLGALHF